MSPRNNSERTIAPNEKQRAQLANLKQNFDLSDEDIARCLVFSSEQAPWIPPDLLQAIALQVGANRYVGVKFEQFIPQLQQIAWTATVIDERERTFERSGVATIGESSNGRDIDPHVLASGRALQAALNAAGFNPFKPGFVAIVTPADDQQHPDVMSVDERSAHLLEDELELRRKDLAQIHKLAQDSGLIVGKDQRRYREWLMDKFHVHSSIELDAKTRASVINALSTFELEDYLLEIPQDLRADALIA